MTERPNIRRMQMAEQDPVSENFNVKTDLTSEDWSKIDKIFAAQRDAGRIAFSPFYPILLALSIHSLDRMKPKIDQQDIEFMSGALNSVNSSGSDMAIAISGLQTLGKRKFDIETVQRDKMIQALEERRAEASTENELWTEFAGHAATMHEISADIPYISEKNWEEMYQQLVVLSASGNWLLFASLAAAMKTLGAKKELVTTGHWKKLRSTLARIKRQAAASSTSHGIHFFADLKTLAEGPKATIEDQKPRTIPESLQL